MEGLARVFDFRVCITNPTAISELRKTRGTRFLRDSRRLLQVDSRLAQYHNSNHSNLRCHSSHRDQQTQAMQGLQQSQQQQTQAAQSQQQSQQVNRQLDRLNEYFTYQWQDMRR